MLDAIDIDDLSSGRFRTMTRKELNQGIPVPGPFHPAIPTEGNLMETSRRSRHLTAKIGWDDTRWVGLAVEARAVGGNFSSQVSLVQSRWLLHQSLTGA